MIRYVYDLCDITNGSNEEIWLNSFRSYPDIKNLVKKIIRISENYLGQFIKFNTINKLKDCILVLEFDVIDEFKEYRKYRILKTIIQEDFSVSKRVKRHLYI